MDVYFSPLACSMASRIALYEAKAPANFIEVDPKTKRTRDGADFLTVNPLGLVPTIRTDDGEVLTENAAVRARPEQVLKAFDEVNRKAAD